MVVQVTRTKAEARPTILRRELGDACVELQAKRNLARELSEALVLGVASDLARPTCAGKNAPPAQEELQPCALCDLSKVQGRALWCLPMSIPWYG